MGKSVYLLTVPSDQPPVRLVWAEFEPGALPFRADLPGDYS